MEENTQQVQFLLKILSNQLKKEFNATLKSYGLTKAQFDTLLFLSCRQEEDAQINQRDLESFFQISNPTVSSMLSRLESKNLIERHTSRSDRRIRYITITDEARDLVGRISGALNKKRSEMFAGIDPEDLDTVKRVLTQIFYNLTGKEEIQFDFNFMQTN